MTTTNGSRIGMQANRARLTKACCSPAKFDLEGAPLPVAVSEQCCEA